MSNTVNIELALLKGVDNIGGQKGLTEYQCPHCKFVLKDAVQTTCGHWLCEGCALELVNRSASCPREDCGEKLTAKSMFPDVCVRVEIDCHVMVCRNSERGCTWSGPVSDGRNHLTGCSLNNRTCPHCKEIISTFVDNSHFCHNHSSVTNTCKPQKKDLTVHEAQPVMPLQLLNVKENTPPTSGSSSPAVSRASSGTTPLGVSSLVTTALNQSSANINSESNQLPVTDIIYQDGAIIWKILEFSQRREEAKIGRHPFLLSNPFYSSRYGYKMCLHLYILGDGIGKGTHMSLFFVVMRGEFDNILQWPFTHKVTFKLINQCGGCDIVDIFQPDPLSSSFQKPKSDMNVASGCPRFVSSNELMQGGFIVDDTIFIEFKIDDTSGLGSQLNEATQATRPVLSPRYHPYRVPSSPVDRTPPVAIWEGHPLEEAPQSNAQTEVSSYQLVPVPVQSSLLNKGESIFALQQMKSNLTYVTPQDCCSEKMKEILYAELKSCGSRFSCIASPNGYTCSFNVQDLQESGQLESPCFYSHFFGYRMIVGLRIHGNRSSDGALLEVYFAILKGEFDEFLNWPFAVPVTVKLVGQGSEMFVQDRFLLDSRSCQKPIYERNVACGCPSLLLSDIMDNGFASDGVIIVKVMIFFDI